MDRVGLVLHHRRLVFDHDRHRAGARIGAVADGVGQHLAAHEGRIRRVGEAAVGKQVHDAVRRRREVQHLQRITVGVRVVGEQTRRRIHRQHVAGMDRVGLVLHRRRRVATTTGGDRHRKAACGRVQSIVVAQRHADLVDAGIGEDMTDVAGRSVGLDVAVAPVDHVLDHRVGSRVGHRSEREGVADVFDHGRRTRERDRRRDVIHRHRLGRGRAAAVLVGHHHRDRAVAGVDRAVVVVGEDVLHVAAEHGELHGAQHLDGRTVTPVDAVAQRVGAARRVAARQAQHVGRALVARVRATEHRARCGVLHRHHLGAEHVRAVLVGRTHRDQERRATQPAIAIDVAEAARGRSPFGGREAVDTAVAPVDRVAGHAVRAGIDHRAHAQRIARRLDNRRRTAHGGDRRDVGDLEHQLLGVAVRTAGVGDRDGGLQRRGAVRRRAAEDEARAGRGPALDHAVVPEDVVAPAVAAAVLAVGEHDVAGEGLPLRHRTRCLAGDRHGIGRRGHREGDRRHVGEAAILVGEADADRRRAGAGVGVVELARRADLGHRAVAPIDLDAVRQQGVGARIEVVRQVERVGQTGGRRGGAGGVDRRRHVIHRHRLGRGRAAAVLVGHRHRDRAVAGIDRTVLVIREDVRHVAAKHGELQGAQHLGGRTVTPVDAVGQGVGTARRVAARQTQHVGRALVGRVRATEHRGRRGVLHRHRLGAEHVFAVLVGRAHRDLERRATEAAVAIDMAEAACGHRPFSGREAVDAAVAPVDRVAGHAVRARIDHRAHAQRVARGLRDRGRTRHRRDRRDVVHRHRLGRDRAAAVLVAHRHRDRAVGGIGQAVLVIREDMVHVAAERSELRGAQHLHRRTVAPVDAVAQRVGAARRIAAEQVQFVGRALARLVGAGQRHRGRHVVDRDRVCAGIRMLAVLVGHQHRDRAVAGAVGIHVGVVAEAAHHLDRAVAPVDGVARGRVLAGVGDRAQVQREGGTFIHREVAAERDRRRDVVHRERLGLRPGAVLVGGVHRDRACRAAGGAVGIDVGHAATGRGQGGRGQRLRRTAIAPVDRVAGDGVGARVAVRDGQGIQRPFGHAAAAGEVQRRGHVVHRDLEAVAARLRAVVVHRHRDGVGGVAVGVGVPDAERGRVEGPAAAGVAVAPVDGVEAAGRVGVGRIGEADRGHEELAFVHRQVRARIHRQHLGRCADLDELCIDPRVGAVLVHQRHRDRAVARARVGVDELAVGRQVAGGDHLHRRAVAPVDAVLADGVVARVIDAAQRQRVGQVLLDRGVAEQRQVGRHVGHHDLEAVGLDAVALPGLVVGGHGHGVAAVVREVVPDVEHRVAGRILRGRRAVAPVHRDQVGVGVGVAERDRVVEQGALGRGVVGAGLQRRRVIDVGEVDDREHRVGRVGDAVAAGPGELVEAEVIHVALVAELAGLQLGEAHLLPREHRHAIHLQGALGRQRGDADRRQVLALRIAEAVDEELGVEHDHRLFLAVDREGRDLRRGVAEALQADLVGVVAAVGQAVAVLVARVHIGRPGHHEAAVGHRGDRRLVLHVGHVAVDQGLAIDLASSGVVLLQEDVVGVGRGAVLVGPAHHPAAVGQAGDGRLVLIARGRRVDAELGAHGGAVGSVALRIHAGAAQVLAVGAPHRDPAAILEGGHIGLVLVAVGVGVGAEGGAQRIAACIEALAEHTGAVAVGAARVGPHHHEAAIVQPGYRGLRLSDEGRAERRVGACLGAELGTARVQALEEDVGILGVRGAVVVVIPGDHEAAVRARGKVRLVLVAGGQRVDQCLPADCRAAAIEDLRIHAGAAAVLVVGAPHHREAARRQADDLRLVLRAGRGGIDAEFTTDGIVVGVVTLAIDPVAAAVRPALVGPHHHVTTIGEMGDRRIRLLPGHGRVDLGLEDEGRHRTVDLGGDVERDEACIARPAVTVGDADRDRAAGEGVARGVLVGEVLDHRLHRRHRGGGVEFDHQLAVVAAVGHQGADQGAAVIDVQARHAHLGRAVALGADPELVLVLQPLHAELVLAAVAADVVHLQAAAIEVGRVCIGQAHTGVDQLRREVDRVLRESDRRGHVDQLRVGLAAEVRRIAEHALEDAVAVGIGVVAVVGPAHHEVAVRQRQHHRILGPVGVLRIHPGLAVHRQAGGVVLLQPDLAARGPRDHVAAVGEAGDRRRLLAVGCRRVDAELVADRIAAGVVALREHAGRAAAILVVRGPRHHEAAIGERSDAGFVLVVRSVGVDLELDAERAAVRREALTEDPGVAAVAIRVAIRAPGNDEAAVGEHGDGGFVLGVVFETGAGVGARLGAERLAVGVEALEEDVTVAPVLVRIGPPSHHKTATEAGDDGLILGATGIRIHQEGLAHLQPVGVVTLAEHAVAAAVGPTAVGPHHDEAAAAQARDRRLDLVVRRVVVHLELVAHRHALRVVALAKDAVAPAVLALRGPHRDVAAVGQPRHRRLALLVRRPGVDHLLLEERAGAVVLGRHRDRDQARGARAAGAVAHLDRHRAGGDRVGHAVGVGQVLDHRLHRLGGRAGVEGHDEVAAVLAVRGDGADRHPTIAHRGSGDADLAGGAALVADAEGVLRLRLLHQLGLLDVAVAGQHAHHELAAGEVRRVGIGQAHRAVDELRRGVDHVLVEADAGRHIHELGRLGAHDRARRAQDLREHAVGVRRAGLLVVARPGHHEVAAGEPCDRGQILRAGGRGVDHRRAVDLVAGGVELLDQDVIGAATGPVVAVPGDHEAAVGERRHTRIVLIGGRLDRADPDLPADLRPRRIEALSVDQVIRRPPHHDEAAVRQHRDVVTVLVAGHRGRDDLLGHRHRTIGVEDLGEDTVAAAIGTAGVAVDRDELAVRQRREARVELGARNGGVEGELTSERAAVGRVALGEHVIGVVGSRRGVVAAVGHHEAAVGQADYRRLVLVGARAGVDPELAPHGGAVGTVALGVNAGTGAVLGIRTPDHHEAAIGKGADRRLVLRTEPLAVDLELGADRRPLGVVALAEHAVGAAVLPAVRAPHHHVAARIRPLQRAHRRSGLLVGLVAVDLLLAEELARPVDLRRHGDLHRAHRAGAAGAVIDADAHQPARRRIGGAVGVGQVLDQGLDRLRGRAGVQAHHQVGAVGTVRHQGADRDAAVAHGVARHADLARVGALVADTELVLRELVHRLVLSGRDDRRDQLATGEVRRVGIRQAHRGVDQLRRGIHRVLGVAHAGDQIREFRRGRARHRAGLAEHAGEHAVAVGAAGLLVVARPRHDEVAAGKPGDVGQVLRAGGIRVGHDRTIDLVARSIELLQQHIVGIAARRIGVAVPGDHEAAIGERGDARVVLVGDAVGRAHLELGARLGARRVEALAVDLVVGRRPPHHDVTAVGQHRHIVAILVAGGRGRDHLLGHLHRAVGVEHLAEHTIAATVVAARIAVEGDELATGQRGQARVELGTRDRGVEGELVGEQGAIGRVALGQHVLGVARARVGVVAAIGHHEAAIRQADHRRLVLAVDGGGVDLELATHRHAIGAVDLRVHALARAVLSARAPHHDEAAVGERGELGFVLVALRVSVDLELGAERSALGVVALAIDAVGAAVLRAIRAPHHHVATSVRALQAGHHRRDLIIRLVGVGLLLVEQRAGAVELRRHVDHHLAGAARHAGAVAHHHLDRARGERAVGARAVAQVLEHALDRRGGRAGIEVDHQLVAVGAVVCGSDRADQRAAIAHIRAGHADLAGTGAFIADRQLVFRPAAARDIGHGEAAGVEAGGAIVGELHTRVEHHPDLGGRLRQRDRRLEVLQIHRRRAHARLDAHQHLLRGAHAAVAVEQTEAEVTIGLAAAGDRIHIGEALHQGPHRLGGGVGVEAHHQVRAGRATAEGADHGAVIADLVAGHGDRACGGDRQRLVRVRGRASVEELHDQAAAAEIGGIDVAHEDVGIEGPRRARVERGGVVVGQRQRAAQVVEHRIGRRTRQLGRIAEELLADLVGVVAAVGAGRVAAVDHREVAAAEVRHHRLIRRPVVGRLELALAVDRVARGVVLADVDVVLRAGSGLVVVVVVETHHEAAGRQRGHLGLVLPAGRGLVDPELAAHLDARRVEALAIDAPCAGAVLVVGRPHHHEAAIREDRDVGRVVAVVAGGLRAVGRGVDQEGAAEAVRCGIVDAAEDAVAAAVVRTAVGPHDHQVAVGAPRDVGHVLGTRLRAGAARRGTDQGLDPLLGPRIVETLQINVVAVGPHRGEAAGVGRDVGVVLRARGGRVEQELPALGDTRGVEALRVAAPAVAIVAAVVLPAHHEAAVRQRRDLRPALLAVDQRVDAELGPERLAVVGEALGVDSPCAGRILAVRGPRDHVAAVGERHRRRPLLRARRVGVDHLLRPHPRRTVQAGADGDRQRAGVAAGAVAVADPQAERAAGVGAYVRVLVAEALDQRLDGLDGGRGTGEVDAQVGAIGPAADRADRGSAVAHRAAIDADLTGVVTLVHHAELILGAAAMDVIEIQAAAGEVGRIRVAQAHRGIDELQGGVDLVLDEVDGAGEVADLRARRARQLDGVAEELLADLVGVVPTVGAGGVAAVDRGEVAATEVGHHRPIRRAVVGRLELALAVDGVARGIVFADVDVVLRPGPRDVVIVVVEGDDEAAGRQRSDLGHVLAAGGALIHPELAAHLVARGVEALADHRPATVVVGGGRPHDDEATTGEHGHVRRMVFVAGAALLAGGRRVHQEGAAEAGGVRIVEPAKHAVGAAVVAAGVGPNDHQAAVGCRGDVGQVLAAGLRRGRADRGADEGFAPQLAPGVVEALQDDVAAVGPHRREAVGVGRDVGVVLRAGGRGVEQELPALGVARGVEALAEGAPAAAVVAVAVLPGDHEAAVRQRRDLRPALVAAGQRVDAELGPDRLAVAGEALGVDAIPAAVLATVGLPGHHVAAVGERRRGRPFLRILGPGIDHLLRPHPRCAIDAGAHRDRQRVGIAGAAVAVADAQAERAAGVGVLVVVAIAQALDQRLHRLDRGGGAGEVDAQVGAVGPAADRADRDSAVAHRAAGDTDLTGAIALVHHAELVFGAAALKVEEVEPTAGEVGRIRVAQPHRGVDDLQGGVDVVLDEADRAGEVRELRARRARQLGGVAEKLLADLMGVVAAVGAGGVAAVDHREVAAAEVGHHRLVGRAVVGRDELALAVDRVARGVVLADIDVGSRPAPRDVVVVVVEGHHEAAGRQRGHLGHVLAAGGRLIDAELAAHLVARGVEALAIHAPAAAVAGVRRPHHHEAAIGEHRDVGDVFAVAVVALVAGGGGVDQEAAAEASTRGVDARKDAVAATVIGARIGPRHDEAPVGPGRYIRHVLRAGLRGRAARDRAHQGLAAELAPGVVEALQEDVRTVGPHRGEAAVVARHIGVILRARGGRVDHELPALRVAGGVEALREVAPAAAVVAGAVLPAHHEAAVRQRRDLRPALVAIAQGVDAELAPERLAVVGEALAVDSAAAAVLSRRDPHHHVAAIGQRGGRGPFLRAGAPGVDNFLRPHPRRAVLLAHDLDTQLARGARPAVAVVDPDRDAALGLRAVRGVGVGEVLQQLLDRVDARVGVELDHQSGPVGAARDRADRHRAAAVVEADCAARDADLADAGAFVTHTELVLGAAEASVKNFDTSAVEVGGIRVVQADHGIEELRRGVHVVLAEHQRAAELVQFRIGLAGQLGRIAEELLVDARIATVRLLVVGAPHDHIVARAQAGDRRLVLRGLGRGRSIDLYLAAERGPGRVVFAHVDVLVRPGTGHIVVVVAPGDGEAAAGERSHVGLVLAAVDRFIDAELAAERRAVGRVALRVHPGAAAILVVGAPGHDEAAALEHRHRRFVLRAGGRGVDAELAAGGRAIGVVALRVDAVAAAVLAVVAPDHHEAAVGERGDLGLVLLARGRGVHPELGTDRAAVVGVALRVDPPAAAVLAVRGPRRDEAAVVGRDRGQLLLAAGGGIHALLTAERDAQRRVALHVDAVAAAIQAALVGPQHHEATVRQAGDLPLDLVAAGAAVDAELGPDRDARGVVALRVDAVVAAVLGARGPHHHVSAACEGGHRRLVLVVGTVGVDLLFGVEAHFGAPWACGWVA